MIELHSNTKNRQESNGRDLISTRTEADHLAQVLVVVNVCVGREEPTPYANGNSMMWVTIRGDINTVLAKHNLIRVHWLHSGPITIQESSFLLPLGNYFSLSKLPQRQRYSSRG
jgi:hypothetical protein